MTFPVNRTAERGCQDAEVKHPCGCGEHPYRGAPGGCECVGPERCGVPCLERPSFHPGQMLTADSLRLGQRYVEEILAARRYIDGVGVVCGMHVHCEPDEPGWVVIEPGLAIDCCGREISLCEPVRFYLCGAVASCPRPVEPCDEPEEEPIPTKTGTITGKVTNISGAAVIGAMVSATPAMTPDPVSTDETDDHGDFFLEDVPVGRTEVRAKYVDPRTGSIVEGGLGLVVKEGRNGPLPITLGEFQEAIEGAVVPQVEEKTLEETVSTYVLRVEGRWEGRDPVPVVMGRNGCDPRPVCRPSKEVAAVRLCVEPLVERSAEARVRSRTTRFQKLGDAFLDRIGQAIEATSNSRQSDEDPYPDVRAVADAMLASLRDVPPRVACGLREALCDVRRMILGGTPRCYPALKYARPSCVLIDILARRIDDLREGFLTIGCDDCCERTGVRLAHVHVQEVPKACREDRCSIVGIDSHAPARESLHPRSSWWEPEYVSVYDAYYHGSEEAGVVLTSRGLQVDVREADSARSEEFSIRAPESLTQWIVQQECDASLSRLGPYQHSVLYAAHSSRVALWHEKGRVVAITSPDAVSRPVSPYGGSKAYFRTSPGSGVVPVDVRPDAPKEEEPPAPPSQPIPPDFSRLDHGPLNVLPGIGVSRLNQLYDMGITSFSGVVSASDETLAKVIPESYHAKVRKEARRIVAGEVKIDPEKYRREIAEAQRIAEERGLQP